MKLRRMRLNGDVAGMGEIRNIYNSGRKTYGKRKFGRPRCIWEDNIRMDLRVREGVDWICLNQDTYQWRHLGTRLWNYRFHIRHGISQSTERLLTFEV